MTRKKRRQHGSPTGDVLELVRKLINCTYRQHIAKPQASASNLGWQDRIDGAGTEQRLPLATTVAIPWDELCQER
jgi:hypothetical protein